jgi:prepilin-type N-terminal cleavage/methylation domain-containing protein
MKRKGFTLVELLVVIAIIALLMGILMPALARVRQLAFRMTCGTNLSGIGKAMLLYSNDYEDELPRAGGRNTTWGAVANWMAPSRFQAYGLAADGSGGTATISSCFYLLVKYAEVTPKSFICKGDAGTTEFKLSDPSLTPAPAAGFELIDAWDFGPAAISYKSCSYSYHIPFGLYALTVSSEPSFAVAADRNPFLESPAGTARDIGLFIPDLPAAGYNGTSEQAKQGNCNSHQGDGQNVMFLDTHVTFEKRAFCSIEDDNIYLVSPDQLKGNAKGTVPVPPTVSILSRKDSVLVHDPSTFGSTTTTRATRGS